MAKSTYQTNPWTDTDWPFFPITKPGTSKIDGETLEFFESREMLGFFALSNTVVVVVVVEGEEEDSSVVFFVDEVDLVIVFLVCKKNQCKII